MTPASCVVLEDSHNGIRAAHAAGTMPVMVPDIVPPTDDIRAKCVVIVDDLHAARTLLLRG
jgi:beta-phosphoglucomutase-like phosphatase (HAD superfamily)